MGRSVLVPFLGRPARFPLGPFVLSELTGAPIAIWFAHKVDRRTVRMKIHEPMGVPPGNRRSRDERLEQAAQRYVSLLEDHVRIHPYEWFNFYDYWGLHDETRTDT